MSNLDPWTDCVSEAAEESGANLTPEQVKHIAEAVQGMHENYGQAVYQPDNPLIRENADLKRKLREEEELSFCKECQGRGSVTHNFANRSSTSQCWTCSGKGKVKG